MLTESPPAGRDSPEELRRLEALLRDTPLVQALMDATGEMVAVLNQRRQVVAASRALEETVAATGTEVVGRRPGEVLDCIHAHEGLDGCGSSRHCLTCGAVEAILLCQGSCRQVRRECRISLNSESAGALDLQVTATPVEIEGEVFTICAIRDISDQNRVAVLNRMFFHDVLNTAGGIQGYAHLLAEDLSGKTEDEEELGYLTRLSDQLVEEIQAQRDLMHAESGDLEVRTGLVDAAALLAELRALYAAHTAAEGRTVRLGRADPVLLETDVRLLARVIGNMIKNALEATPCGGAVTLGCAEADGRVVFSVHNPGAIPEVIQLQIFQRSFSTRGQPGRGIGTHSMKLLGERYLGGRVGFTSTEREGTVFTIALPKAAAGAGVQPSG